MIKSTAVVDEFANIGVALLEYETFGLNVGEMVAAMCTASGVSTVDVLIKMNDLVGEMLESTYH